MKKYSWLLVLGALVIAVQLGAEEIQLKDGTKVTGKLVGVTGETFQVKTAYGDINIPRSEVVSITFPENAPKSAGNDSGSLPPIDEELKGETYTNRTASFQITVPSGWKLAPELRTSKDVIAALDSPDETLFLWSLPRSSRERSKHTKFSLKRSLRAVSAIMSMTGKRKPNWTGER